VIACRLPSTLARAWTEQIPLEPAVVRLEDDGDEFHLFHGRVRYGASSRKWRATLVRRLLTDHDSFPGAREITGPADARALVDEVATNASILARALDALYGTPDLGNVTDPVSELVYIVLCWRTRIPTGRTMLDDLRSAFPRWEDLVRPEARQRLEEVLRPGGFLTNKSTTIVGIIAKLIADFGAADLSPLRGRSDEDVLAYLTSLPGLDLKGAQCVMLYALGRRVFPVDAHTITVLSRLGTLAPLVGELVGLEHRVVQRRLKDAVAPRLRGPLHVNLVVHGREVCKATRPECERCELRKLCAFWRARQQEAASEQPSKPVLVDLFAGAGGLSTGFLAQGYRVALAVDSDRSACRTLKLNHPEVPADKIVCADVDSLTRKRGELRRLVGRGVRVDVLAAGLPCQGFSKVGYRTKPHILSRPTLTNDPRNRLFKALLRAVAQLTPEAVLVENVPDMRSAGEGKTNILRRLERGLTDLGYSVQSFGLNAARLGLPQVRHRLFVVALRGSRTALDAREWLLQQHGVDQPLDLTSAIEGLPHLKADEGAMLQAVELAGKKRLLFHHEARAHNPLDLKLFSLLRPGENSLVALERGGKTLMRYSTDNFHDKYFRLKPGEPCRTIVSHLHKDANGFIHPYEDRGITAREAARVQGFLDDYIFLGSRCDQFIQIGNAVPPLVGRCFAAFFDHARRTRPGKRQRGNHR